MSIIVKEIESIFKDIISNNNLEGEVLIERPREGSNGDFSSNFAMINSKLNNSNPIELANKITTELSKNKIFDKVEVAGPGFINMTINEKITFKVLNAINKEKEAFGSSKRKNFKYNLELVSANPTGYLHVGHGRNGAIGDSVARILRFAGYDVETEYYTNDAGNQINVSAVTLFYHYKLLLGQNIEKPEEMYGGDMYIEVAKAFLEKHGDKFKDLTFKDNKISDPETHELFKKESIEIFMREIKKQLIQFGVEIQLYTSEAEMYSSNGIEHVLSIYKEKGKTYELDGALWLKTTEYGDDKDRVLVKSNGDYTYITPDLACHQVRIERSGADKYVNFWGGDHHGYISRMNAGLSLLGNKKDILSIDMIQMVRLMKDGQEYKMSKRKGTAVWLIDLIEMVGKDAVRYMLLSKTPSSHMDFDLDVAVQKNATNPVYYAQYATARCNKIITKAADMGLDINELDTELEINDKEKQLIILMDSFNRIVEYSASSRLPNIICEFIQNLSKKFHSYYGDTKIFDENNLALSKQKVFLIKCILQVLSNAFNLIGIEVIKEM